MKWLAAHAHEYAGQWVALDGDTLIAHDPDHRQVWAAAEASGAYPPLVTFLTVQTMSMHGWTGCRPSISG